MEEKITNDNLEKEIKSLRASAKILKIISKITFVIGGIIVFLGMIPVGIILIIISGILEIVTDKNSKKIKSLLSDNIVDDVLKEVLGDNVEYNPGGCIHPGSIVFPFSYDTYEGSDHIKANYKGLNIEMGDIRLIREDKYTDDDGIPQETSYNMFIGQWLKCDFGKELSGDVYISEWESRLDRKIMKSQAVMDNKEFADRFCVRADDPEQAFYILTPHMMEYILSMADKSGGRVYMSFMHGGQLNVAVKTNRDLFELGKTKADAGGLRQKYIDELKWFTDIVDTLRVEDTIYKKTGE